MAPFSNSQGWNVLALTLLSALIHPEDKAASMPQCLSCKPTLWELQSTVPPPQCSLFFPPQRGFAPASDKGWEEDETEDSAAQPLSRNMKDFWKANSWAEENYAGSVWKPKFLGLCCFFPAQAWQTAGLFEYCCVSVSRRNNIAHKTSRRHQSSLSRTLKPAVTLKYLTRASKSVSPEGLAGPCPQTFPGGPVCV